MVHIFRLFFDHLRVQLDLPALFSLSMESKSAGFTFPAVRGMPDAQTSEGEGISKEAASVISIPDPPGQPHFWQMAAPTSTPTDNAVA